MTCGALDIGCHVAAFFAPAWAFVLAWWWVAYGAACLLLGAWMGPRATIAVLTIGLGLLVYDRTRRGTEPDYETGERAWKGGEPRTDYAPAPKPKKRKTLADLFGR